MTDLVTAKRVTVSPSATKKIDVNILTGAGSDAPASGSGAVFDTASASQQFFAAKDILGGLANYQLWMTIGWRDIKQRYRRSTLGPLWVTLSMGLMVIGLGLVYSMIFKLELRTYLPFLCLGFIVWEFISKSILDGSTTFLLLEGLIKQICLPLTTHIASTIWKNIIILGHNAVIYVAIVAIYGVNPGWNAFLAIPGLALVLLNLTWVALLLALVCTRYRDVPIIVQSAVQLLFFVTPVFWSPSLLPERTILVHGNPFYHMIEVIRAPLQGDLPPGESWVFLIITLGIGWAGTFIVFSKFRRRIAYWL